MIGKYDEQARFEAQKLKSAVVLELTSAMERGDLQFIKVNQINDIAEIVYQYYAEYNRPYSGGSFRSDINNVIGEALYAYNSVKNGNNINILKDDDWGRFVKETRELFKNKVEKIDIVLDGCDFGSISRYGDSIKFVNNPIYQFAYLGNGGPFSMAYENEQKIPVREQYCDNDGNVLREPLISYYVDGDWQSKLNTVTR